MRPQFRRWLIIILMWAAFVFLAYHAYSRGNKGTPFLIGVVIIALALIWLTRAIWQVSGRKR